MGIFTSANATRGSPENGDAEVVAGGDVRRFDVVTEEDQRDEQIVDVGLVDRQEDHGSAVLREATDDISNL